MNNAIRTILSLLFLSSASTFVMSQQGNPLFLKVENAIRAKEPDWTMMNRWPGPQGQSIGYLWRLDEREIFVRIVIERSTAEAISYFQDDGFGRASGKSALQKLDIGDECYLRQMGPQTAVVLRKNNLL